MNDESETTRPSSGLESVEIASVDDPVLADVRNGDGKISDANQDLLLEVVRRTPILRVLGETSARATDIVEAVDLSRSTVHRATDSLQASGLIERRNEEFRLTNLGRLLFEEVRRFETLASTAFSLAPFLNTIELDRDDFPIGHFVNASITQRKPRQPHATIHRIIELIEESDRLRMFSTVISPVYVDVGYREMIDGMEIEAIFEPEVAELMLSEYPDKAQQTLANGNFTVYTQGGLPCELFISDSMMGMAAHNETGNAEVLIECEDQAAIEWAERLYEKYRSSADSLDWT